MELEYSILLGKLMRRRHPCCMSLICEGPLCLERFKNNEDAVVLGRSHALGLKVCLWHMTGSSQSQLSFFKKLQYLVYVKECV